MNIQNLLFNLFEKKEYSDCIQKSSELLSKDPDSLIAKEFKAASLFKLGKFLEAKKIFLEILNSNKNIFSAHLNLARIFSQEENFETAEQFYKNSIIIQKDNPHILIEQARFYKNFKKIDKAKLLLINVLKLNKDLSSAHIELANIYFEEQNYELALKYYEIANNLIPNNAFIINSLGSCFYNLDNIDQAEKLYLSALEHEPNSILTLSNLAYLYQSKGDFDQSIKFLNNVLKINPRHAESYRYMALQHKFKDQTDPVFLSMLNLYKTLQDKNEKMHLGFALAKAHEDLSLFKESSDYLKNSNAIRRNFFTGYNQDLETESFHLLKKTFSYNFCNQFKSLDFEQSNLPIFILGMPRSGTSLVEQILSSHQLVQGGGELNSLNISIGRLIKFKSTKDFCKQVMRLSKNDLKKIGEDYVEQLSAIKNTNKTFVTDKLPVNFQLIGLIKVVLPNAKIIHVYRSSKDNCFSILKNYFSYNVMPWSYDEKELVSYYNNYKNLIIHYNNILPDKIYHLKYEDLISDPEKKTRALLDFCNLDWDKNCLNFKDNKREVKTASIAQVRKGLYSSSVESWKNFEPYFPELFTNLEDLEL